MKKKETARPAKKKRRGIQRAGLRMAFRIVLIVIAVVSILFIAARTIGGVTLKGIVSDIRMTVSNLGKGDGYPYKFTGETPAQLYADGRNVFLFASDKTTLLSASAKTLAELPISYGSPAMDYNNGKAIVYDRDSGNYRVQSTSEILLENTIEDSTICAGAIGRRGNFALAYTKTGGQTALTVLTKSEKKAFSYEFKEERVTAIDLSDDGKYAAVATLTAKDLQANAKVYIFRFDTKDAVACYDYAGCVVVRLEYDDHCNVAVITDQGRSYIEDTSTLCETTPFAPDILYQCCDTGSGFGAVALRKYGGDAFGTVHVFKGKDLLCTLDIDKEIKGVACTPRLIAVLTPGSVELYNKKGEKTASVACDMSADTVLIQGKKLYLMNAVEILCESR